MLEQRKDLEGGCGVIGVACTEQIGGKHLLSALAQMRNRGNGKGGGIAAVGLSAQALGVANSLIERDYILAIAYLDLKSQSDVERQCIEPTFEIDHVQTLPHISDFKEIKGLELRPPEVILYFVRVKDSVLRMHQIPPFSKSTLEDEIVYQTSYSINRAFYAASGEKRAFVLSHGRNLLVVKMVGYGDDVIRYYQLEDFPAHVWIGHHRYPTKGRVWHPGGAHPFVGMNEALVHNGDFANYFSMCEYLSQRKIYPLFLTDTEVAVLIFDLLYRTYGYPLEYVIEALAPTTERDFTLLSPDKQHIYELLQKTHIHGSPDGPWFFLIAQSLLRQPNATYRLIGITDTSMLRPQVFAIQHGTASVGLIASEKQAIDATLSSLSDSDPRFWTHADAYWNARGGSYTDGGAFTFSIHVQKDGTRRLECTDKFDRLVHAKPATQLYTPDQTTAPPLQDVSDRSAEELLQWMREGITEWSYDDVQRFLASLNQSAFSDEGRSRAITVITTLIDQPYSCGFLQRSRLLTLYHQSLARLIQAIQHDPTPGYASLYVDRTEMDFPHAKDQTLIIDARGFAAEGDNSLARTIVNMYRLGFKRFLILHCQGQRFIGVGLGPGSHGVQIDVYGSSGDYLASGIDGAHVVVHGHAQDQLGQIMKEGTLVVHGDVGQTFMYGSKGGQVYVRGNAAGRPLINSVGKPRVVINGTCLDYLAESFMAGNPLEGGGFVIVNGLASDEQGGLVELETPYPGNNLFSLASGGAIYLRDPNQKVAKEQLNGGEFTEMTQADWKLILPHLETNEKLFGIPVNRLLEHQGRTLEFHRMYRKVHPTHVRALQEEEAWVRGRI